MDIDNPCLGGTSQAAGKLIESFSGAGKVCQWWSSTRQDTGPRAKP